MRMIAWATATAARCEPRRCLRREDWARRAVRVRAAARAASTRARRMAAVAVRRALPDHLRPGAGQRPHRPRLAGRDVAAPHPPVPQQIGQPLGVVAVGRPPRTFRAWRAFTSGNSNPPPASSAVQPGGQDPPLRSIATGTQPASRRQAASASSPSVIVENRRSVFWTGPSDPGIPRQATTSRWWTSTPHQGGDTTSIARAPPPGGLSGGCGARSVQGLSCVRCRAARNLLGAVWAPGSPSLAGSLAGLARPCSSIAHPPLRRPQRTRSHHLFSSPGGRAAASNTPSGIATSVRTSYENDACPPQAHSHWPWCAEAT